MKCFLLVSLLTVSFLSHGQSLKKMNFECVKRNNLSNNERLKYYPFNISHKIVLVSFLHDERQLQFSNKLLAEFSFKELRILNSKQIDSLTNILYNIGVKGNQFQFTPSTCYFPRNAILFLDVDNRIKNFIEICFECRRTRVSSKKINDGISCEQKFDLLKSYFNYQGIRIGTAEL